MLAFKAEENEHTRLGYIQDRDGNWVDRDSYITQLLQKLKMAIMYNERDAVTIITNELRRIAGR